MLNEEGELNARKEEGNGYAGVVVGLKEKKFHGPLLIIGDC
jgi:hypothetical protein